VLSERCSYNLRGPLELCIEGSGEEGEVAAVTLLSECGEAGEGEELCFGFYYLPCTPD
jgi:hypothetical protein